MAMLKFHWEVHLLRISAFCTVCVCVYESLQNLCKSYVTFGRCLISTMIYWCKYYKLLREKSYFSVSFCSCYTYWDLINFSHFAALLPLLIAYTHTSFPLYLHAALALFYASLCLSSFLSLPLVFSLSLPSSIHSHSPSLLLAYFHNCLAHGDTLRDCTNSYSRR